MDNDFVFNKVGGTVITVGTDPEFFLKKAGKLLPAFKGLPEKGPIFADGFQAEINPKPGIMLPPLRERVKQMMAEALRISGADEISPNCVERVDEDEMATAGKWRELGCQPSINIYGVYPDLPLDGGTFMERFAGNHIHFGRICNRVEGERIVRALDGCLAVWMTGVGAGIESPIRRQYYGLAGEIREQKWGLEYRTLSNLPLLHPALWSLTFKLARDIFNLALFDKFDFWKVKENDYLRAVNETDPDRSRAILADNQDAFGRLAGPLALEAGMHGFGRLSNSLNVRENWGI